jgi:hypothetical protein
MGDGLGLGSFDSDASPAFRAGHDLSYYGILLGRPVGLAQLKLCFPPLYYAPCDFALELDCALENGLVETVRVAVPAGTCGPNELHPLGQVIPLTWTVKLRAEGLSSPYAGTGLYIGVRDIRLVEPVGAAECHCLVTSDVPFLADSEGVLVTPQAASFVALQLAQPGTHPHLLEDAVGQLFLFRARDGNISMQRRRSLTLPWETERVVTRDGASDYPWADKDERGTMILVRQVGLGETAIAHSRDDGETWEEV